MKITTTTAPARPFELDVHMVTFYTNIVESTETDGSTGEAIPVWTYEQYELPMRNSPNLAAQIAEDYDGWLEKAKAYERETEAQKVREHRNRLLDACDTTYCNAANWSEMDEAQKSAWRAYKQSLKDVPAQEGFPYQVTFPNLPV